MLLKNNNRFPARRRDSGFFFLNRAAPTLRNKHVIFPKYTRESPDLDLGEGVGLGIVSLCLSVTTPFTVFVSGFE